MEPKKIKLAETVSAPELVSRTEANTPLLGVIASDPVAASRIVASDTPPPQAA
jgi:hypothetical protein